MTFRRRLWHLRQALRVRPERGTKLTVTTTSPWISAPPFAGPITDTSRTGGTYYSQDASGNIRWKDAS